MKIDRAIDRFLEVLKSWEAKYYRADYARLRDEYHWCEGDGRTVRKLPALNLADIKNVLVFKPDEIGDAVYALPAMKLLRESLPQARIFLVCQKKTAPLFERTGLVDEIATVNVKTYFRKFPVFSVKETMRKLTASEFDVGIFLRSYPGYFRQFKKFPCRTLIHPRDPRMTSNSPIQPFVSLWVNNRQHQAVQLTEIVAPITRQRLERESIVFPQFRFSEVDRAAFTTVFERQIPSKYIVVHPFADFETRHYVYWNELTRWLRDRFRIPVVTIGGKQDPTLSLPGVIQAQGRLSLGQTAYLISKASVFIGNLSGPVHLAGALGTPNITLMSGHSAPSEWTPFGDALVLRADVGCAPCHLRSCHKYNLACVRTLNPLKIMPHIDAFISARLSGIKSFPKPDEILFD